MSNELKKLVAHWHQRSLDIAREHDTCVRIVETRLEPMPLSIAKLCPLCGNSGTWAGADGVILPCPVHGGIMEKRGVVIDDEKTKTGSAEKTCPQCGNKLSEPDKCENCGTEPFEKRPD